MPGELRRSVFVLILGCGQQPGGDAASYSAALGETESYEDAVEHCGRIEEGSLRGDCRVALMEGWNRMDPSECAQLESSLWRDECLFQLGERQWEGGDLLEGLQTCEQTRFRRNCAWHLVQYEVLASLGLPPTEAEDRILGFANSDPMPDAAFQFWLIRFRELSGEGRPLDEQDCEELKQPEPCRAAVQRHVISSLETQARRHLERLCTAASGERVTLKGKPAWVSGPVSLEAEAQWIGNRCSEQDVSEGSEESEP